MYKKYLEDKELYLKAQRSYKQLLDRKQILFDRTQPGAVKYEGEKVDGGIHNNSWDVYIDKTRELEDKIKVAEEMMKARKLILELSLQDLRASTDTRDIIFVARYLDRKRVYQIPAIVNYSERQDKIKKREIDKRLII